MSPHTCLNPLKLVYILFVELTHVLRKKVKSRKIECTPLVIFNVDQYLIFDISQQLVLKPGSKSYGFWTEPPQPLYLDIYLWNWTNPHDIRNKSIKPNFVQIGPFRFQEYPSKTNVNFHDNATVSYRKSSKYFFVPEDSKGQLDDVITSLNVISLVCIFLLN